MSREVATTAAVHAEEWLQSQTLLRDEAPIAFEARPIFGNLKITKEAIIERAQTLLAYRLLVFVFSSQRTNAFLEQEAKYSRVGRLSGRMRCHPSTAVRRARIST